jgi:hypothetical protein
MPKIITGKKNVAAYLKDRMTNHGPVSFKMISVADYVALGPPKNLKVLIRRTINLLDQSRDTRTCCSCDNPVWRLAGTGMCYPCTTGHADASEDYELIPEPVQPIA